MLALPVLMALGVGPHAPGHAGLPTAPGGQGTPDPENSPIILSQSMRFAGYQLPAKSAFLLPMGSPA